MPKYVYHINEFYEESSVNIAISNRSFKYGDGLFETIRVFNGKMTFLSFHFARIQKGLQLLNINIELTIESLTKVIENLLDKNNLSNARIRLMVFRNGGGLYEPINNEGDLLIESVELPDSKFIINEKGLSIGLFKDVPKVYSTISLLKTNNALPYIMASNYAKQNDLDTCILLNEQGKLADTIYSNIFMVKEGYFFCPPVTDGGVAGTMQAIIIQLIEKAGWEVYQNSLTEKDLLTADEVFLTNAIKGIQWVENFNGKEYKNQYANLLLTELNNIASNS